MSCGLKKRERIQKERAERSREVRKPYPRRLVVKCEGCPR